MTNSWRYARINTGFNILLFTLKEHEVRSKRFDVHGYISVWSVIRSSQVAHMFWIEVFLCSLHAPPIQAINDKWGLFMLLRFYMVFRIIRDRSIVSFTYITYEWKCADSPRIYKRRNTIMRKYIKYGIKHWGPPKFNWFLAVKSLFVRRPFPFMFLSTLWALWVCGHIICITYSLTDSYFLRIDYQDIFEREVNATLFTYLACLYVSNPPHVLLLSIQCLLLTAFYLCSFRWSVWLLVGQQTPMKFIRHIPWWVKRDVLCRLFWVCS